jgi:RNA polymerase sigma-70 factor, ECF subfamily
MDTALRELLVPHLDEAARARIKDERALEECLERVLAEARGAWPKVRLGPETFLPYLAARVVGDVDPVTAIGKLGVSDLWLACACVRGDGTALAAFEAAHFDMVDAALARMRTSPAQIDEVKQHLREVLFVGGPDRPPGLTGYSGRGSLGGWLRVTAVRVAIDLQRKEPVGAVSPDPDLVEAMPASDRDPELEQLKVRYRVEFKQAFEAAVQRLERRDRNLLRYHHLEGLTVDQIGLLYHVARSTAARWVARARDAVLAETRRELAARLRLQGGEFESIMRLIQSQLHVSLSAILPPVQPETDAEEPE